MIRGVKRCFGIFHPVDYTKYCTLPTTAIGFSKYSGEDE